MLGGGRALLMQVAHPLVAAGVADHSDFTANPFDRLWRTLDTALTVIFGDTEQSREAIRHVTEIHGGVRGRRGDIAYSALDPDLLLWVHATLVDSSIAAYEAFVGSFPEQVRESYYLEMRRMGTAFGIPEHLHPPTYAAFRRYLDDAMADLEIGDECRQVARQVLSPEAPLVLAPAELASGLAAGGLLPPAIRDGLRLRWTRSADVAFAGMATSIRVGVPLLPDRVRRWPHARAAERRMAAPRGA